MYSLIMSGGTGTRFWPLSREAKPKQVLDLFAGSPLIQETIKRVLPLTPRERIFVVTTKGTASSVLPLLDDIPEGNVIVEPLAKNTAPCILLGIKRIFRANPAALEDVVMVMPSDHFIGNVERFQKSLSAASIIARETGYIVTLGIIPHTPETGYGYINTRKEEVGEARGLKAFGTGKFIEKPDHNLAVRFIKEGGYFWNSGIFIGKISLFLEEYERYLPHLTAQMDLLMEVEDGGEEEELAAIYRGIRPISIDYGIMEYSKKVALIPCDFGWQDLGSWTCLEDIGRCYTVSCKPILKDSRGLIIYSPGKLTVALGVKDLLVVDTEDVLLVADKARAQEIKGIVEELKERGETRYV